MYQLILVTTLLLPATEAAGAQARAAAALALSQAEPVTNDVCECGGNPDKCVCAFGSCYCLTCDPSYTWKRFDDDDSQVALMRNGEQVGGYSFKTGVYRPYDKKTNTWGDKCKVPTAMPAQYLRNFEETCHKRAAAQQSQGQDAATYQGYELLPPGATYYADPGYAPQRLGVRGRVFAGGGCASGSCGR